MTRNLRTLSVTLILALGPGATATSVHADVSAKSLSAGSHSYLYLSDAATGWFDNLTGVPPRTAKASHADIEGTRPLYRPPRRGAPATRIGGGSRSRSSSS